VTIGGSRGPTEMPEAGSAATSREPSVNAQTPPTWRIAALTVLLGGLVIGAAAAGGGGAQWIVLGSIAIVVAGLAPIVVASRRPPVAPEPLGAVGAAGMPLVTVLIAARDEAAVVPRLIAELGMQDHREADGSPRFEVILIDDRSADGTGAAAISAAAAAGLGSVLRVVRREGPGLRDGKGAALAATTPDMYRGELIVVLDADARIGPTFLRQIAGYAARGVRALTVRRRIRGAGSSHLAGAQADEQTQDGELQRGRWASGGCSEFRGNGTVISRDLLAAVGGWPAAALTDDLDLSSRVAAVAGITVAWTLDVEVWEEPVLTWGELWRQRLRWSEGAIRRFLELGPTVLRSDRLTFRTRLDFAVYGAQLAVPPLIIGATLGALATGAVGMAAALLGTYLAAAGLLAFDALRWEEGPAGAGLSLPRRVARAVRAAAFGFFWLGSVPAAMWRLATRRGRVRYDKMAHVGTDDAEGRDPAGSYTTPGTHATPAPHGTPAPAPGTPAAPGSERP
jgi:1,2-diacylglycerol 3-beta-glucosyltransferase